MSLVDDTEKSIASEMAVLAREFEACRKAFLALGDENRQLIIIALLEKHGGMRVGEITKRTNLSRPAVSHHLKILREAGIIAMFKEGTMNFYHVDANDSQWGLITTLVHHVNELIEAVSPDGNPQCDSIEKSLRRDERGS